MKLKRIGTLLLAVLLAVGTLPLTAAAAALSGIDITQKPFAVTQAPGTPYAYDTGAAALAAGAIVTLPVNPALLSITGGATQTESVTVADLANTELSKLQLIVQGDDNAAATAAFNQQFTHQFVFRNAVNPDGTAGAVTGIDLQLTVNPAALQTTETPFGYSLTAAYQENPTGSLTYCNEKLAFTGKLAVRDGTITGFASNHLTGFDVVAGQGATVENGVVHSVENAALTFTIPLRAEFFAAVGTAPTLNAAFVREYGLSASIKNSKGFTAELRTDGDTPYILVSADGAAAGNYGPAITLSASRSTLANKSTSLSVAVQIAEDPAKQVDDNQTGNKPNDNQTNDGDEEPAFTGFAGRDGYTTDYRVDGSSVNAVENKPFSFNIDIGKGFFSHNGEAPELTSSLVKDWKLSVDVTGNSDFKARIVTPSDDKPYIEIRTSGAAKGIHSLTVTLSGGPADWSARSLTFGVGIDVAEDPDAGTGAGPKVDPPIKRSAIDPGADLISGTQTGSALERKDANMGVVNGMQTLDINASLIFKVPADNFTSSGGGAADLSENITELSKHLDWIVLGGGNESKFDKVFYAEGSDIQVKLTPKTTGIITNFSVKISDGANGSPEYAALQGETIVVHNASIPVFLGIADGLSAVSPASAVSSMQVGDTVDFVLNPAYFHYATTPASSALAAMLKSGLAVSGVPANFGWDIVYDSANSRTVLRLTANSNGSVGAANIQLTDSSSPAPAKRTLVAALPAVKIETVSVGNNRITGVDPSASLGANVLLNGSAYTGSLDDLEVAPGDVIDLVFDSGYFEWENGKPSTPVSVTNSMLRQAKIEPKVNKKTNGNLIDSVSFDFSGSVSSIRIKFAPSLNSVSERKFSAIVYFNVSGKRHTDTQASLAGVMANTVQYAYSGDEHLDLTSEPVVEAEDTVRNISLYVGSDVSIVTSLSKGRKYYASSNTDYTSSDEDMLNKYYDIVEIIHLETHNINKSSAKLTFDTSEKYYVYGEDGKYLGTTSDRQLAYSDTLYLAAKKLTLATSSGTGSPPSVIEDSGDDITTPNSPPVYGGEAGSSSGSGGGSSIGSGYNPNTGVA